jgi:uncharacterized protein
MREKNRVVVIHGAYGSPQENWFPWLAMKVEEHGFQPVVPAFPTPDGQNLNAWKEVFNREIGDLRANMILVGHSLGVGFILNLLEDAKSPIRGCFLVSGFVGLLGLPQFDAINSTFVDKPFDWITIKRNSGTVHVYNSDNDPYVPLDRGKEIARNLGVELTVIKNGGHINASAGYTQFAKLAEDLITLDRPQS